MFNAAWLRHSEFRAGALDALGAAPGLAAWGLMTGVAMMNSGLSTFEALLMGVTTTPEPQLAQQAFLAGNCGVTWVS
ncbi:hypothetical protein [Rhodoferax antarcticus]|uniref:Uncharacterized protein n=1 Tax=Rhodoferax antarcticus ANT.BR TaxID=1111071 RepID=A0A1Q8YHX9_9BURK|nr:hypothetical protein BLL52_0767 [Rhodoferax antarcticus ANT.BR]